MVCIFLPIIFLPVLTSADRRLKIFSRKQDSSRLLNIGCGEESAFRCGHRSLSTQSTAGRFVNLQTIAHRFNGVPRFPKLSLVLNCLLRSVLRPNGLVLCQRGATPQDSFKTMFTQPQRGDPGLTFVLVPPLWDSITRLCFLPGAMPQADIAPARWA